MVAREGLSPLLLLLPLSSIEDVYATWLVVSSKKKEALKLISSVEGNGMGEGEGEEEVFEIKGGVVWSISS